MARASSDILIRTFFEFAIADLRRNAWLLPDVFGGHLDHDTLAKVEYGGIEARNATEWFLNNQISTVLYLRKDIVKFPCISIALLSSEEMKPGTSLADEAFFPLGQVAPTEIGRPQTKVYQNFTPAAYDPTTGTITLPDNLNTNNISPMLQVVVDTQSGKGYQIKSVLTATQFTIAPGSELNLNGIYIAPIADLWNCHRGRSRFVDVYEIGVHGNSQPMEAIWLSELVEYILLRYKPLYLDKRGVTVSSFSSSNVSKNDNYVADTVYSKFFTLTFQMETDWIKSVHPRINKVTSGIVIADGPKSPEELLAQNPSWIMEADVKPSAQKVDKDND